MPTRPFAPVFPDRTSLAVCLAAAIGLTLSAAHGASVPHALRRPAQRAFPPSIDLAFSEIARALKPGGGTPNHPSATLHHVTACNDDPNDPGSLRSIIASPGTVSGDSIDFVQLGMMCSTITLSQGHAIKVKQDTLYLYGPGAANLTIDGNDSSTVLYHVGAGTLYVSGLTIANGQYIGSALPTGGCIYSQSNVFLLDSIVTHCSVTSSDPQADAKGGGLYTADKLTLVRSTISDSHAFGANGAEAFGGGAFVLGSFLCLNSSIVSNSASATGVANAYAGGVDALGGIADIEGSTISGNAAKTGVGGLVLANGSGALIANSTISGNVGSQKWGGIVAVEPLTIANSTIAFNHSIFGPPSVNGVYGSSGVTLTLHSSIIADNSGPLGSSDLGGDAGSAVFGAHNLVVSSTLPLPIGSGNIENVCPKLDPLADNGGPTQTHGLNHASPAIDSGDAGNTTTDQRGTPRPSGAGADIGAVERQPSDLDERIHASNFDGFCDY